MAIIDATISDNTVNAALLFFADFVDLPIRGAFAPGPLTVPGALTDGDADCWGFTFDPLNSDVLQVSAVSHEDGGTDTLAFTLFADAATPDLLTAIENPALYVGRKVRVWAAIWSGGTVTELRPLYRGYMTQPGQQADGGGFTITMEAENYLALLSAAQGRTYVQSTLYDASDTAGAVIKGQAGQVPGLPGGGGNFPQWDAREREK